MNLKQESSDVDKIFFKCPIVIMTSFNRNRLMLKYKINYKIYTQVNLVTFRHRTLGKHFVEIVQRIFSQTTWNI